MVELKKLDIFNARNYVYKDGEAEDMSNTKFDRALKDGDLSEFPNVTFFQKKRQAELERIKLRIQDAESEDARNACKR